MVFIRTVPESEATGIVKEVYDHCHGRVGVGDQVPDVVKVFSIQPRILKAVEDLRTAIKDGASGLGRDREEMIAVVVSAINRCTF
jgi:alkylhydroperoxidase family enzyme